jgi:hypothetical protein
VALAIGRFALSAGPANRSPSKNQAQGDSSRADAGVALGTQLAGDGGRAGVLLCVLWGSGRYSQSRPQTERNVPAVVVDSPEPQTVLAVPADGRNQAIQVLPRGRVLFEHRGSRLPT